VTPGGQKSHTVRLNTLEKYFKLILLWYKKIGTENRNILMVWYQLLEF